jgi:hypothetical protein
MCCNLLRKKYLKDKGFFVQNQLEAPKSGEGCTV